MTNWWRNLERTPRFWNALSSTTNPNLIPRMNLCLNRSSLSYLSGVSPLPTEDLVAPRFCIPQQRRRHMHASEPRRGLQVATTQKQPLFRDRGHISLEGSSAGLLSKPTMVWYLYDTFRRRSPKGMITHRIKNRDLIFRQVSQRSILEILYKPLLWVDSTILIDCINDSHENYQW